MKNMIHVKEMIKSMEVHNGKYLFGTTKMGERGQIVIPKEAREKFDLKPGDTLIVLGDEKRQGLAIVKADLFKKFAMQVLGGLGMVDLSADELAENDRDDTDPI